MKLGKLADSLRALAEAEKEAMERRQALGFGGNEETIQLKRQALEDREAWVRILRDEEIERVSTLRMYSEKATASLEAQAGELVQESLAPTPRKVYEDFVNAYGPGKTAMQVKAMQLQMNARLQQLQAQLNTQWQSRLFMPKKP